MGKQMGRRENDQRGFSGEMEEGRSILRERHVMEIRWG